jgi:hypothetical protein
MSPQVLSTRNLSIIDLSKQIWRILNEKRNLVVRYGEWSNFRIRRDTDVPTQKAVVVVQEYWGLNDHIKDIALVTPTRIYRHRTGPLSR